MLDWACLAPRPQNRLAEPRSATGYKAPPAAASALSTPPIYATGFLELCTKKARPGELKNSDIALPEGSIAKRRGVKVMMMMMVMMVGYEGQKWVRELTKWAPPSWCVESAIVNILITEEMLAGGGCCAP
jgi:hypothetical protein